VSEIRLARADDFSGIAAVVNHYIVHGSQHFGTTKLSVEDVRVFAGSEAHPCFVAVGSTGSGEGVEQVEAVAWSAPHKTREAYRWTVDVAVYVRPEAAGKGLGAALQGKVVDCIRRQGYVSALAVIGLPNEASVRLHEGLGFRAIGVLPRMGYKHGAWRDIGVWHLGLREVEGEPQPVEMVLAVLGG
jgi:phosphinothricin acetyltransferase